MTGKNLLGLAFRIMALAFAVVGGGVAVSTALFVAHADSVVGEVIGFEQVRNSINRSPDSEESGALYYPIVSYASVSGVPGEFIGPQGRANPRYHVGDHVPVLVSRDDPGDARLDTLLGTWGTPVILGALAVVFLILGLGTPRGFGGAQPQQQ